MVVVLCVLVLLAWSSTQVVSLICFTCKVSPYLFSNKVEPVVQSVILVERTAVGGATAQASSAEEVEDFASHIQMLEMSLSSGEGSSDSIFAAPT